MSFCTALHTLKSPQNVGMIVRSHVAYGGNEIVFIRHELPWRFKKGSRAFSRRLEQQATILHFKEESEFFQWALNKEYEPIAIEIDTDSIFLDEFRFPGKCAIVLGNEATGLPKDFLHRCRSVVTIPQYGEVGSLNVAVSASIAMYELNRGKRSPSDIDGHRYKNCGTSFNIR